MVTLTHFFRRKPAAATYATLFDKQQGIFYMHFSIDRTLHTTAFDKPVVDHWFNNIYHGALDSILFEYKLMSKCGYY